MRLGSTGNTNDHPCPKPSRQAAVKENVSIELDSTGSAADHPCPTPIADRLLLKRMSNEIK